LINTSKKLKISSNKTKKKGHNLPKSHLFKRKKSMPQKEKPPQHPIKEPLTEGGQKSFGPRAKKEARLKPTLTTQPFYFQGRKKIIKK